MAKIERREQILEAAANLAIEEGLEGVTVRAVAAAAGVGMGTLRHHFPSQAALHEAVLQQVVDDTVQDFSIGDVSCDPGDRLVECVLQFLPDTVSATHLLDMWFAMYRHALEPGGGGMATGFLEVTTHRSHARLRAWLEQLAGEGVVDADRVDYFVLLLSALISGACLEVITPGAVMTVESAREVLEKTVRELIVKEPS